MPEPELDDFHQLELLFIDPIQHDYEVIRKVVLYAETLTQHAAETGLDRTTIGEKARRFVEGGMLGLADGRRRRAGRKPHPFPERIAGYLLYAKQLYPPVHDRELVRIVRRKFGYHTNHHTVRAFLERHPLPVQLPLPLTRFHQFEDAYRARWTVVRMYYEGWQQRSIAAILDLSHQHVWEIIAAFKHDGFAGLEDKRTRPSTHPANQLSLPFLKDVLAVQREYPRAGRFRVRGLLARRTGTEPPSEATVGRAMALNRRLHGAPAAWVTDRPDPSEPDGVIKDMPYHPTYRHRYWFIDYRYLVRQVGRVVNLRGYVSVQRSYIYAERGLSRKRVSVWLYDGRLHVAHQDTLLAHYAYRYDRQARRLRAVEAPHLYRTVYASPQLELWELDDEQWRKVMRRPYERHPRPADVGARQLVLPIGGLLTVLIGQCVG